LAITANTLINVRQVRHHAFDYWLCEFAHPFWRGTKLPKLIDLLRAVAALKISPEMILNRSFSGAPSFTHYPPAVWNPPLLVRFEFLTKPSRFPPLRAQLRSRG